MKEHKATFHGQDQDIEIGAHGLAWYDRGYGSWCFKPNGEDFAAFCDKSDLEFD